MMMRDWLVTVRFPNLPEDADKESVNVMVTALLDSNGEVPYRVESIEKDISITKDIR
jgi:hypothetical protein